MTERNIDLRTPEYEQYVEGLSRTPTKKVALDSAVTEIMNKKGSSYDLLYEPVFRGETNNVYKADLPDGRQIFVKVSYDPIPEFERARWAMDQCRNIGIRVPIMHGILTLDGETPVTVAVEEKVNGIPLSEIGTLSELDARRIFWIAGEMLSDMHTIRTTGFGTLNGNGNGRYQSVQQLLGFHLNDKAREKYMDITNQLGINPSIINQSLDFLAKGLPTIDEKIKEAQLPSVLCHNDLSPWHIMYDPTSDQIMFIDFGQAKSLLPDQDLAKWELWHDEQAPVSLISAGYKNKAKINHKPLRNLLMIDVALKMLLRYYERNFPEAIRLAVKGLQKST